MNVLELEGLESLNALNEIPTYQRRAVDELLLSGLSREGVAELWLGQIGPISNAQFGSGAAGPGLFENFKREFNKLLCGDPAYDKVRKDTSVVWKKYKSGMVLSIAAAIGAALGVAAVVLVPAVALLLSVAANVGINAWCATHQI